MTTDRLRKTLLEDRGEGLITGLLLLAGVLIPMMFLVPLYARIELAQVDSQQAARAAVRSAVQAPDASAAHAAAAAALAREQAGIHPALSLSLTGSYARGEVMSAQVITQVPLGSLPVIGHFGTVVIRARASAPIDRYRSITEAGAP